jgi:hypothetical protein
MMKLIEDAFVVSMYIRIEDIGSILLLSRYVHAKTRYAIIL